MAVTSNRQSGQIEPFVAHALEQFDRRGFIEPVGQPAIGAKELVDDNGPKAMLIAFERRKQCAALQSERLAVVMRHSRRHFMDDLLQPPQAHRYIDEIAAIVLPIFSELARGGGEQIDEQRIERHAARNKAD